MPQSVIAYVDGFNLYFGLKDKGWQRYYRLYIQLLVKNFLKPGQNLILPKYFTARVSSPADKAKRQSTFMELGTLTNFESYFDNYQLNLRRCCKCCHEDEEPKEKMTDVNIAVELLRDAYEDRYDMALLISADSDLVPPIRAVREIFPEKTGCSGLSAEPLFICTKRNIPCQPAHRATQDNQKPAPSSNTEARRYHFKCPDSWR